MWWPPACLCRHRPGSSGEHRDACAGGQALKGSSEDEVDAVLDRVMMLFRSGLASIPHAAHPE